MACGGCGVAIFVSYDKNSGKQVLKVVLLSHHNETIKQDRSLHCL